MDFELDIHTISEANNREHWAKKHKRSSAQREIAMLVCKSELSEHKPDFSYPVLVKLTRFGKRKLDDDNLGRSFKAIRDGIADALGIDDGDTDKLRFFCTQEHSKVYSVKVWMI